MGINKRVFVLDVSESRDQPLCFINPEIIDSTGKIYEKEGCLSVYGAFDKVKRAANVTVKAINQYNEPFEVIAEGLFARCIQHEINHLDGILFIDHLARLKQDRIHTK